MTTTDTCISANLGELERRLTIARNRTSAAIACMAEGNRNGAIGTLVGVEHMLAEARALTTTVLLLHRAEPLGLFEVPS